MQEIRESRQEEKSTEQSYDYIKQQLEFARTAKGNGTCPKCHGLGLVPKVVETPYGEAIGYVQCECAIKEANRNRRIKSGLISVIEKYTFEKYIVKETWQAAVKTSAINYAENPKGWFFIGGQVGAGKTHLCTAIVAELMEKGMSAKYMVWPNEAIQLKANKMNDEKYQRLIEPFQKEQVLYIDDFLKTERGKAPTASDIMTAFEILNYRYNNGLITVISSEKNINDILDYDGALGSRIYEMSKEHINIIREDEERNYRLR